MIPGDIEKAVINGESIFFFASGKWCPRREWSSPPDAQRAASDARRGVLYSSVFLGSPGKFYELLSSHFSSETFHPSLN